jgi:hypothetical protein
MNSGIAYHSQRFHSSATQQIPAFDGNGNMQAELVMTNLVFL